MNYLKTSFCMKYKCYDMIILIFLQEFMKIRPGNQKKAIFFTIGIFWIKGLILNGMFVMNAKIYQRCL